MLIWFRTTLSQYARIKNGRLKAGSTLTKELLMNQRGRPQALLRRSCSGIQNRGRTTGGTYYNYGRVIGIQRKDRKHPLCLQRSERDSVEDWLRRVMRTDDD